MLPVDQTWPGWMRATPKPQLELRTFNTKQFMGWQGRVSLFELEGWVDNPRIDTPVEKFKAENIGREPSNDELLEIMLDVSVNNRGDDDEQEDDDLDSRRSRKNKLLELAESIRLNGIRVPLIVTPDKRILDGNRRYFASLYLYRMTDDEDERDSYEFVPVWVLPESTKREDEERVLTELNSINDCYVKWPYSVIARRVYRDYKNGSTIEYIQRKYHDWTKGRITTVIEACKIAEEFIEHHDDAVEAKDLAYRKLVWFDELRRSNNRVMGKDDFRSTVYDLILERGSPFSSHRDFKRLGEIYENPEAWRTLRSGDGKDSLRQALYILERDQLEARSDVQSRMSRINTTLRSIINGRGFGSVDASILVDFHELADQVPGESIDADVRAGRLLQMLDGLTSREIARLPDLVLSEIEATLQRVRRQAAAARV